jgi:hypothetical protein
LIGAEAAQEDVRALFHHRAGEADRVARVRRPRHRAGPTSRAFHDRRVMFDPALVSEDGAAAGVEMRVVLQDPDRRLDRLQRGAAAVEQGAAGLQRLVERGSAARILFVGQRAPLDDPAPAMHHKPPCGTRCRFGRARRHCRSSGW